MDPTDRMTVRASVREGLKEVVFWVGKVSAPQVNFRGRSHEPNSMVSPLT